MSFSIYRFRINFITLVCTAIALLSLQANVGLACETQHKSVKVLSVNSENFPPVYDVAVKRIWVQKNTPLEKIHPAKDHVIHAKIKIWLRPFIFNSPHHHREFFQSPREIQSRRAWSDADTAKNWQSHGYGVKHPMAGNAYLVSPGKKYCPGYLLSEQNAQPLWKYENRSGSLPIFTQRQENA